MQAVGEAYFSTVFVSYVLFSPVRMVTLKSGSCLLFLPATLLSLALLSSPLLDGWLIFTDLGFFSTPFLSSGGSSVRDGSLASTRIYSCSMSFSASLASPGCCASSLPTAFLSYSPLFLLNVTPSWLLFTSTLLRSARLLLVRPLRLRDLSVRPFFSSGAGIGFSWLCLIVRFCVLRG